MNGFRHGVVYIDGKDRLEYAIDLLTGAKIWQFDLAARSGLPHSNAQSTAALVGNRVIVPYAKYVFSINAVNGKQVWRSHAAAGEFFSSPSVSGSGSDRVAFVGDTAGVEHAYRVASGTEVFRVTAGGPIFTSAALAFGTVVFGADDGYLYALGRSVVPS